MLLASCGGTAADGTRLVRLAGDCYRIPAWNAMPMDAAPVWPGFGGRESERSASLRFLSSEVARSVPDYPAARTGAGRALLAGIFFPTEEERTQQKANKQRAHHDIWYALGDYQARALEPIPDTALIRVFPLAGGNTWMVVTRPPDTERRDTHLQDDFWIANCHYVGTQRARTCSLDVDVGVASISLHVAEAQLPMRHELARYVSKRIESWQVRCGS
jgi:hypothetical protein